MNSEHKTKKNILVLERDKILSLARGDFLYNTNTVNNNEICRKVWRVENKTFKICKYMRSYELALNLT